MQATRLLALNDIRTVDLPIPEPGPGEIAVRVLAAGICGTDRHLTRGEFPCAPPVTLGHEFAGEVVALGIGAEPALLGRLVTCDPNIACGSCPPCLSGRVNLCRALSAVGVHRDGGFAEIVVFPAHRALPLPPGMGAEEGAFCEPLACCLHGVDLAAPIPGQRAIILGGGVIGLLTLQLARLAGADAMLVTRHTAKRDLAADLGATVTVGSVEEAAALWPNGADVVLECAGVAETVGAASRLARRGGRVIVMGVLPQGERVAIEPFDLLVREIVLRFAFLNPFTQSRAVELIAAGRVLTTPLVSRRISVEDAPAAIRENARLGEVKVLVLPV